VNNSKMKNQTFIYGGFDQNTFEANLTKKTKRQCRYQRQFYCGFSASPECFGFGFFYVAECGRVVVSLHLPRSRII